MLRLIPLIGLALFAGGCDLTAVSARLSSAETRVIATVQKIKTGASVAIADVQDVTTFVCTNLPEANDALAIAKANLANVPKAGNYLAVANASLVGVNAFCSGSQGSGPQVILNAYKAFKAAQAAINSAAGAAAQ